MRWQPLPAELARSGALHGLSAFTTVRTRHGEALLLPAHLARLTATCAFLGLSTPPPGLPVLEPLPWGLLRLTVTPEGPLYSHQPLMPPTVPSGGVTVWLGDHRVHPQLGLHKTGNYLPYLLARRDAEAHGAFEGLLLGEAGHIADGSRSGLLLWRAGRPLAPEGGLPSVTRAAWLAEQKQPLSVAPVSPELLRRAEHLWLCGSGIGIVPVGRVCTHDWEQGYEPRWPETEHPALVIPG